MCESGRTNTNEGTQLRPEGQCGGAEITDRVSGERRRDPERGLFSLCGGSVFPLYVFKCIQHVSTFRYVSRCILHVSRCIPCIVYSGYVFRCIQHVFVTDAQETCADTSVIQRGYMRDTYIIHMEYVFPSGNHMDTNVSCCYAFTIHQTHYNTQRIHCRMHVLSGRHAIHTTIHAGYIRNTLQSCILCPDTCIACVDTYVSKCIPMYRVVFRT